MAGKAVSTDSAGGRLAFWLALVGCVVLGPLGTTCSFAGQFTDVPEGYWAYQWIEWLADLGIVRGYPDPGNPEQMKYDPESPVTRGQMAVFVARTIQHLQLHRGLGLAFAPSSSQPYELTVIAPANVDAEAYRLDESMDGINFSPAANATYEGVLAGYCLWGVSGVDTKRYFKPLAVINGDDQPLCSPVMARPTEVVPSITIVEPLGLAVSRLPTISWNSAPGAVAYTVAVVAYNAGVHDVYRAVVDASRLSVRFGQTEGPGILWAMETVSMLEPNTEYHSLVRGFDASGWAFSSGGEDFTTGTTAISSP